MPCRLRWAGRCNLTPREAPVDSRRPLRSSLRPLQVLHGSEVDRLRISPYRNTLGPVAPTQIRVRDPLLEIDPDPRVAAAVEGAAGRGSVVPDAAPEGPAVQVHAVAVRSLLDQVRLLHLPADDPLPHVLLREG